MALRASRRLACGACPFTRFEHGRWEGAVAAYDRMFGHLTSQAARHVVDRALQATARLQGPAAAAGGLDCATGPGMVIAEALRRGIPGSELVGADFSAAMLDRARDRIADAEVAWLEMDIQKPLPESAPRRQFGWCTCNFGVLHLARPEDFFAVARQLLCPGGALVFTVWAELAKSPAFQIPLRAIEEHGSADVGLPSGPPFFKYSDPAVSKSALIDAGFDPAGISAELVDLQWVLDQPEDLWKAFYEGTARTGGMLERQEPDAKRRMQGLMRDALCAAQPPGHKSPPFVLTQPCLVVTAVTPLN